MKAAVETHASKRNIGKKKHKDNEINGKEKKFKRKKRSNRARETATTINDRGAKNSRIEI